MYLSFQNNTNKLLGLSVFSLILSVVYFVLTGNYTILYAPLVLLYILIAIANWKIAYWMLILCIPISIQFSLLNNTLSLSLPDEPMCWLFLIIFILLLANNPRIIPAWWWQNPLSFIIILQFLWLITAVCFSTVLLLSLKFLIAKTWYLACFFIFPVFIFKEKKDFKTAFVLFLLPLLATVFIIFYRQTVTHFNFVDISDAVSILYINHVEYAAVVSIFFPLIYVAYVLSKGIDKWIRLSLLIIVLFFIPVIFFTYARVAILAILFAVIVGLAIRVRLVNFIMPVLYASILLLFVYLLKDNRYINLHPDYDHTVMHTDYSNHLLSTMHGRDVSSMERLYRWVAAIRMSIDRPVVGYGPHAFVYNYKPYAITIFKTFASKNAENSTTHNYFLYMLTEQGWPAMILYALLIIVVFAQAQKTYHRFNDRFYKYCTLGLAMAFAASFINNFFSELIETHKAGAMFYLIIALLMILREKSKGSIVNATIA